MVIFPTIHIYIYVHHCSMSDSFRVPKLDTCASEHQADFCLASFSSCVRSDYNVSSISLQKHNDNESQLQIITCSAPANAFCTSSRVQSCQKKALFISLSGQSTISKLPVIQKVLPKSHQMIMHYRCQPDST